MKLETPLLEEQQKSLRTFFNQRSGLIVFPTETFYAIGCRADNDEAVKAVYKAKKRSEKLPMLVLVSSWEMLKKHAFVTHKQEAFLKSYWPGPLSVIFRSRKTLSSQLNAVDETIAFRMTSDAIAAQIIEIAGVPLVGTSANLSGQPEASVIEDVQENFGDLVDIYLDGGETPGGQPSTLIRINDNAEYEVLRQGVLVF